MTRKIGIAAVALLVSSVASLAADLPRRPIAAPVSVPMVYNWTGLYLGVNGGYGWGRQDPLNLLSDRFDRADSDINGGMIGGTIGGQIQQGYIVLGLEADLDWASIKGHGVTVPTIAGAPLPLTMNMSTKIDAVGTARARLASLWITGFSTRLAVPLSSTRRSTATHSLACRAGQSVS